MKEGREYYINPELMQLPETRMEIMTKAGAERAALFAGVMKDGLKSLNQSELFQKAINLAPLVGDYVMAAKAFKGEEAGRKLSWRERGMYSIGVSVQAASMVMIYWGMREEALAMNVASEVVTNADAAWHMTKKAAQYAVNRSPKLARIMETTADWFFKKGKELPELTQAIQNSMADFDPESVNFNEFKAAV